MAVFDLTDSPAYSDLATIRTGLDTYNRAHQVPVWHERPLAIFSRNPSGKVVGGINGYTTSWGKCEIECLWLAESEQGQGVALQLMQRAEIEAKHRGCTYICLNSSSQHPRAMQLYQKLGFEVTAEHRQSTHFTVIEFMKRLTP